MEILFISLSLSLLTRRGKMLFRTAGRHQGWQLQPSTEGKERERERRKRESSDATETKDPGAKGRVDGTPSEVCVVCMGVRVCEFSLRMRSLSYSDTWWTLIG